MIFRACATLLVLAALGGPVEARQDRDRDLKRELATYGLRDVDLSALSTAQKAMIRHQIYSGVNPSRVRGTVRALQRRPGQNIFKKLGF